MVGGDRLGDVLQENRLAGARRRHDQGALPLADRRDDIDDPGGIILLGRVVVFELDALVRVKRRPGRRNGPCADLLRILEIDGVDLEQGRNSARLPWGRGSGPRRCRRCAGRSGGSGSARCRCRRAGQVIGIRRAQEANPSCRTSTTPSPMISTSRVANLPRIANISSCLRMMLAFSTSSLGRGQELEGDLDLSSWSLISLMGNTFVRNIRRGSSAQAWEGMGWTGGPADTGAQSHDRLDDAARTRPGRPRAPWVALAL